jgi:hypothetical protein
MLLRRFSLNQQKVVMELTVGFIGVALTFSITVGGALV